MGHAAMAVPTFASQRDAAILLVENGSPLDQFADAVRCFMHHQFDDPGIADPFSGGKCVGHMVRKLIHRIQYTGDASLCPGAVRKRHLVLADDDLLQTPRDLEGRPQPCDPTTDDQDVGECMGNSLGMKSNQVTVW